MKRFTTGLATFILLLISMTQAPFAADQTFQADEIMPVSEVKEGMKGYGKTVFKGVEIERFDIEVVEGFLRIRPFGFDHFPRHPRLKDRLAHDLQIIVQRLRSNLFWWACGHISLL